MKRRTFLKGVLAGASTAAVPIIARASGPRLINVNVEKLLEKSPDPNDDYWDIEYSYVNYPGRNTCRYYLKDSASNPAGLRWSNPMQNSYGHTREEIFKIYHELCYQLNGDVRLLKNGKEISVRNKIKLMAA